jgi:2-alkenal reductase
MPVIAIHSNPAATMTATVEEYSRMKNRKNIAFGTAILVLALAFGVGANQWIEPGRSWAAEFQQQIFVNEEAAATVAEIEPTQALLADLYDQIAPSVVNIQVTATRSGEATGSPFGPQEDLPVQGQGSGWIYDEQGHIVTNNHVVEGATEMTVYFSNGMWAEAELVATDPAADLAVIQVTPPDGVEWRPLPLAQANSLRVGFAVIAVGSPFGLQETMTAGVVSALGRSVPTASGLTTGSTYSLPDVIQTDTAINPGNSGGPLLNMLGEVVGVNFAINSTSGSNSGVGFAIPVSVVQKIIPALINDGAFEYSYLGISGATVNAQVAEENNLEENTLGIYVAEVVNNGPTAEAGVESGDVIVAINDVAVSHFEELISYLFSNTAPGDTVTLHLLRGGEAVSVEVTVAARPSQAVVTEGETPELEITISEAIRAATEAVQEAGVMEEIEGASASASIVDGRAVWIVTLTGQRQTATVTVDGTTGEVLDLNVG